MKVLFLGSNFGNDHLEFLTLKKLYHNVEKIDPSFGFGKNRFISYIFYKVSPKIFEPIINIYINTKIKNNYDLIYVKSGEYIGKNLIINLKKKTKKIVYYCNDNPYVKRDNQRWKLFLSAAKYYDLLIFHQESRIQISKKLGLKNLFLTLPPYDKNFHKKKASFKTKKKNDVVFVGTWFPERGIFFNKLINLGLDVKIYGTRWEKDPNFHNLKPNVYLGHVVYSEYTKIIQNSKIALALFSDQNEDLITRRVTEITAIGTLLCSFKTKVMTKIFIENKEVIYFKNAEECFKKCCYYLKNAKLRKEISLKGKYKTTKILKVNNHEVIKKIIKKLN